MSSGSVLLVDVLLGPLPVSLILTEHPVNLDEELEPVATHT